MGAAGVAMAAAGTHNGGGDLARTAAEFLLIHAGVIIGLVALRSRSSGGEKTLLVATSVLMAGTIAFSGDLAVLAFTGRHPFAIAAPAGGIGMLIGWILIGVGALRARPS